MGVLDGIKVLEMARVPPPRCPACSWPTWARTCSRSRRPAPTSRRTRPPQAPRRVRLRQSQQALASPLNMKAPEGQAIFKKLAAHRGRHRGGLPARRDEAPGR